MKRYYMFITSYHTLKASVAEASLIMMIVTTFQAKKHLLLNMILGKAEIMMISSTLLEV